MIHTAPVALWLLRGDVLWDVPLVLVVISVVAIVNRVLADRNDRQRIREYVESRGGKVLKIAYDPFGPGWWGSRERIYQVTHRTHHGRTATATCKTSMFSGVYWTGEGQPVGPAEEAGSGAHAGAFADMDTSHTPAEPILCLRCGAKIPARATHCSKCGWSYQG